MNEAAVPTTAPEAVSERKNAGAITKKYLSIQCLRALAALFVVIYHASVYSGQYFGGSGWQRNLFGGFASIGVAVFFAISGLLMADLIQRSDPWRFLAHRIVRIYPPYLLAVAAWLSIDAVLRIHSIGFHLFSLALVPAGKRDFYLGVEWTLVFECTYYVALFLIALIGWHRSLNRIALVWIAVIAAVSLFLGWSYRLQYPIYSIWLSPINAPFIGGLLIPWITTNTRIPIGTGILSFCIFMIVGGNIHNSIVDLAVGAVATLLVLDVMRIDVPSRALVWPSKFGDWSYALYLCHCPCIWIVYQFWPSSLGVAAAWFSAVGTALAVSAGFGNLDVRMYRHLKNAVDGADPEYLRRLINIFAGAFLLVSLIALVFV